MKTLDLSTVRYVSCGGECAFYTVKHKGKRVGLKVFSNKTRANTVRRVQANAWKYKLGPAVLSMTHKLKNMGYGYLTEIVDVNDNRIYNDRECRKLCVKFERVFGIEYPDFHEGNIGYDKDKNLVFIDFGDI